MLFSTLLPLTTLETHLFLSFGFLLSQFPKYRRPWKEEEEKMAMARLAVSSLQQTSRVSFSSMFNNTQIGNRGMVLPQQKRWGSDLLRRLSTATDSGKVSDDKSSSSQGQVRREVAVSERDRDSKKSHLSPSRRRKGSSLSRRGLWRNDNRHDLIPFSLNDLFPLPLGLENALLEATENLNRLFMNLSPSELIGRMKEDDEAYKFRFEVPGLSKEEVKITIEDGFLVIKGEHKEDKEEGSSEEDEHGFSRYYYNTSFMLPEDAKVDDIKAELKDGVLTIIIPRMEKPKKDVKEVPIQ